MQLQLYALLVLFILAAISISFGTWLQLFLYLVESFVPLFGTSVPLFGMCVRKFGMSVPYYGTKISHSCVNNSICLSIHFLLYLLTIA